MSAITTLSDEDVTPHVADIFAGAKASMGKVPNLFRILAHAPAALDVYTGSKRFLHEGVLSPQAQEQIAIAIASANGCDYCLAAHTGAARAVGVSAEDRASAQNGRTSDPKIQAVLDLALAINATHGQASAACNHEDQGKTVSSSNSIGTPARYSGLNNEAAIEGVQTGKHTSSNSFSHGTSVHAPVPNLIAMSISPRVRSRNLDDATRRN